MSPLYYSLFAPKKCKLSIKYGDLFDDGVAHNIRVK